MTAAEELRKEGKKEGKLEVAKKMLQANIDTEQIVELTGLTIEEIEKIKKDKY